MLLFVLGVIYFPFCIFSDCRRRENNVDSIPVDLPVAEPVSFSNELIPPVEEENLPEKEISTPLSNPVSIDEDLHVISLREYEEEK